MNKFTVHYPNGMKRRINRLERDLLASSLTEIGPKEYRAGSLQSEMQEMAGPAFLEGSFIFVTPDGRKVAERLETPRHMTERLIEQGIAPG